jgi:hypothetical protein
MVTDVKQCVTANLRISERDKLVCRQNILKGYKVLEYTILSTEILFPHRKLGQWGRLAWHPSTRRCLKGKIMQIYVELISHLICSMIQWLLVWMEKEPGRWLHQFATSKGRGNGLTFKFQFTLFFPVFDPGDNIGPSCLTPMCKVTTGFHQQVRPC